MEAVNTRDTCPRCGISPHPNLGEDYGATSRASMSGEPHIPVCAMCRERETFRGSAGLRMIGFEEWPIDLADLMQEEALRLRYWREKPVDELLRARRRREAANQPR
jgi:hypothetical protein